MVNIMGADVLLVQGARASATMMLNWINLVPACLGLNHEGLVSYPSASAMAMRLGLFSSLPTSDLFTM